MTAGIEGRPGKGHGREHGSALSVTVACLTDQEWEATAPMLGMSPDERAGMQCLMEALGGPGQMATAMRSGAGGRVRRTGKRGERNASWRWDLRPGSRPALHHRRPRRPWKRPRL